MRDNLSDADELRFHRLGALAHIGEVARRAVDEDDDPLVALAYIAGRATGAIGHARERGTVGTSAEGSDAVG